MADILVIDDDAAVRKTVRRILERDGHAVREAEDGEAGIREIRKAVPDLVVTDLFMPEKEGIETIIDVREDFPELKILAISGGGSLDPDGPLADARLLGADGVLAKPFSVDDLQEAVRRLLG